MDSIPSAADPSRVLSQPQSLPSSTRTMVQPVAPSPENPQIILPGAEEIAFELKQVIIEGVTAYPQPYIDSLTRDLIGRKVTLQDIVDAANRLNQKYRDDGYIFARGFFPPQEVTEGRIRLQVVEGYINNVTVQGTGKAGRARDEIVGRLQGLTPFNINEFEHRILQLNKLPGATFKSVLRPPSEDGKPGAIDVILVEERDYSDTYTSFDNYGSQYAGPTELTLSQRFHHVLTPYDEASMQLFGTIPTNEVRYGQIGYSLPIAAVPGLRVLTSYNNGFTTAGSNLDPLDIKGIVRQARGGLSYDLPLDRQKSLLFESVLDIKSAQSKILGEELYTDRLRVIRLTATYQGTDSWQGATLARVGFDKGLNILNERKTGSLNLSRIDGTSDFKKATLQVNRLQSIAGNFQVFGQLSGQYAFDPLLSSEEFGFGGGVLGRGYDPSEITGDSGLSVGAELRYNYSLQNNPLALKMLQPYVFYEAGKVWQKGETDNSIMSAASAGAGSRFYFDYGLSLEFAVAMPLTLSPGNPPKYANDSSPRYLFSITKAF